MPDLDALLKEIQQGEIELLKSRLQTLKESLAILAGQINALDLDLLTNTDALDNAKNQQRKAQLEEQQKILTRELLQLKQKLFNQKAFDSVGHLRKSLYLFNYTDQIGDFTTFSKTLQQTVVLALQGTPECGLSLLLRRMLRLAQVKEYFSALINFDTSSGVDEDTIWYKVGESLQLDKAALLDPLQLTAPASLPIIVTDTLFKKLDTHSVILKFDNIDAYGEAIASTIIFKFWKEFLQHSANRVPKHRLFICLLHRKPEVMPFKFEVFTAPDSPIQNSMFLPLKPVKPVRPNEFSKWIIQEQERLINEAENAEAIKFKDKPSIFHYLSETVSVREEGEYIRCLIDRIGASCEHFQLYNQLLNHD